MEIRVAGKQVDVGVALRAHITSKIEDVVKKYAERATEASVTISKDAHLFTCDCWAHLSSGMTAQASSRDDEPYAACDQAVARLEKQLRRHKRRLKDHHRRKNEAVASVSATAYVLGEMDEAAPGQGSAEQGPTTETDADVGSPPIIAEESAVLPKCDVGEAVMRLELMDAPFLLFLNEAEGRVNLVYRRNDGAIGWIDPNLDSQVQNGS